MDGAVNPATIAITISIVVSILAGLFSMIVALRSRGSAAVDRDR